MGHPAYTYFVVRTDSSAQVLWSQRRARSPHRKPETQHEIKHSAGFPVIASLQAYYNCTKSATERVETYFYHPVYGGSRNRIALHFRVFFFSLPWDISLDQVHRGVADREVQRTEVCF